jgi:acyl dehydratase
MSRDPLYFDDIQVGDTFQTATHTLDIEQIKAFARQFDPQPFHLDEGAARTSRMRERARCEPEEAGSRQPPARGQG